MPSRSQVRSETLERESEAEDQEQLDNIYDQKANNEDGNANGEKWIWSEVEEKRIKESEQKRNETRKQEEEKEKERRKERKQKLKDDKY